MLFHLVQIPEPECFLIFFQFHRDQFHREVCKGALSRSTANASPNASADASLPNTPLSPQVTEASWGERDAIHLASTWNPRGTPWNILEPSLALFEV